MSTPAELVAALHESHEHLVGVVDRLPPGAATLPAYPAEWSIGDTLSHVGSGAEITLLVLQRAVQRAAEPEQADFIAIWDRWNAKAPDVQVVDSIRADHELTDAIAALDFDTLGDSMQAYGMTFTWAEYLSMRLDEHVLHTWDVEVARDRSTKLPPAHVPFLLTRLPIAAPRSAGEDPDRSAATVRVAVTQPDGAFVVDLGPTVSLRADADAGSPDATLPAEAFVRLVYGRLGSPPDDGAAGSGSGSGRDVLEQLEGVFHGY